MNKIKLIDSHAHLNFPELKGDLDNLFKRSSEAGVEKVICVGTTVEDSREALELAKKYPFIYASSGVHPHEASSITDETYREIKKLAAHKKVIAIGEVGLDYHYEHSPKETQKETFASFINLAREVNLPLSVHTREAEEDTINILKQNNASDVGGVIHCFSGSLEMANKCMDMGFYISIPGIVTFKNAKNIHQVVKEIPMERMLIETDSPYLAPVPFRGKTNEPAYVKYVAEKIAELKGLSFEDISRMTYLNSLSLFGLGANELAPEISYKIRDSLYLNITNRCTNRCTFCAKNVDYTVKGHYLKISHEPTAEEIIKSIGDSSQYKEIVFCGYGEPLLRLDIIKEVSKWLKERNVTVRINTDGLANRIYKRNILPELSGLIDSISVSLNADCSDHYNKICCPPFSDAYNEVKKFIFEAKNYIPQVTASVVGFPDLNIEKCRKIAESELGVEFRLRTFNDVG